MMEERMKIAVLQACRALRKRHRDEEGAHGPAIAALATAVRYQGAELIVKVELLQQELNQIYRTHTETTGQLLAEKSANQTLLSQLADKDSLITELRSELSAARTKLTELEKEDDVQKEAINTLNFERTELKLQILELESKLSKAELDNKMLVDRWMEQKMQDAERLNEANAMYEDMMERLKSSRLEELARQQVDGIVRHSEAGAEFYVGSGIPTHVRHTIQAHEGGGGAIAFEHGSGVLLTGGNDSVVRQWDSQGGTNLNTLRGATGTILDLTVSSDNKQVLAACSDHKIYLWDAQSGRIRHTLTGHSEKVVAIDLSPSGNKRAVSASYDRTIKLWDLGTGYGVNTIVCYSNCNSVCVTSDGALICSGHMDGNLRFWDIRSGKLANEVAAHGLGITSVSLSRTGHTVLTSGRDNAINIFDVRSLEIRATYRSPNFRAATNWCRSCLSPNENYVAVGSADGAVVVWSRKNNEGESVLKGGHTYPVLACAWSGVGKPLATADKSGRICIWE
ncbi:protein MpATG16 [Marchantia polymorpha subsp. ruderalis]|uniref:Autophagy-related protein 16 domain-containing protein n=2 Tax=Marchantia polymorpha TaxID=3197 RepID=A0A176WBJ5_MARPO|nr:hypothetical protein AXG93_4201s1020 [Marchantia polymorpha subsp. ruderalis]PTQ32191.1 hypothetical protein MARPO_0102s0055 [Marchantia polymorpha]BBN17899.1 hypothetical protein Mp_7g17850 [Marchantia polymorpha subsp. ruderalis]|eukprot:PTQ32191.1 hypothetical protein MARPO_0102s0055 [Marchantia polymorpha]